MDNTIENKAKFFAKYWRQPVMFNQVNENGKPIKYSVISSNMHLIDVARLYLTPISLISDEDAIEVTKILKYKEDDYFVKNFGFEAFEYFKDEIKEAKHGFLGHIVNESSRVLAAADYLLSQGYYLGDGTEIDYGWVKLKEQTK